jgi:SAM-dependent methyltransferase
MLSGGDRDRLLLCVRGWFDAPAQVQHYQEEASNGPTMAEAWLLGALPTTGRVLDLGCGAGHLSTMLVHQGYDVVGADVSLELLRIAAASRREGGAAARFLPVDPLRLPFQESTFDAALAFKVYGYLPGRAARQQYLHEVCRLLRPDAPLLLTQYVVTAEIFRTYRLQADHQRAAARFPSLESGDAFTLGGEGYLHVFTPAQLRRELVSSGLDLVTFVSDRPHGGEGWLRFAVLRKPSPDVESRPTLVASAGGTEDTP